MIGILGVVIRSLVKERDCTKKKIVILLGLICVLNFIGCGHKYKSDDFIGKTSVEIISAFGAFDCTTMSADTDGLYKNCRCGYTIRKTQKGFFGTSAEVLIFIVFDENGKAVGCEENYRPGN